MVGTVLKEAPARRGAGRPRAFDADVALDKALRLFWRHGYEATSMADIVAALGIGAPSLYAAFGNKAELFEKVVERYAATFSVTLYGPVNDPELSTHEAVEGLFNHAAFLFSQPETPAGCFMYSAAAAVSPSSGAIEDLLREKRAAAEARLAARLAEGQAKGEVSAGIDPVATAKYFNCVMEGMSVQARDGATHADLLMISRRALRDWAT